MAGIIAGGVLLLLGAALLVLAFALAGGNWIFQIYRAVKDGSFESIWAGFAGHLLGIILLLISGLVSSAGLVVLIVSIILLLI